MFFVCAITGFAAPPAAVGATFALFCLRRRKRKPRKEITANVTTPTPLPIPAFAPFRSPDFFLGPPLVVAVGLAGTVLGRMGNDVAVKDE